MQIDLTKVQEGVLVGKRITDWVAGSNSPITREVLCESGNWKDLKIPHELQVMNIGLQTTYDTLMCVSFNGVADGLEYIMMQKLRLGLIPSWKVNWLKEKGYFKDGAINFSDRYFAINGKTTDKGAYLFNVIQGAREFGAIPESMFPHAETFKDNIDPKFLTEEMLKLGKEFAKLFPITYEWISREQVREFLKYSPVACFGKYGNMENDVPIKPSSVGTNHMMLVVNSGKDWLEIDDSYWQHFKKYEDLGLDGFMAFYVETKNTMEATDFIKANDLKVVWHRETGAYYLVMQGMLKHLKTDDRAVYALIELKFREQGKVEVPNEILANAPIGQF